MSNTPTATPQPEALPYEPQTNEVVVTTTTTGEYQMVIPAYNEIPLLVALNVALVAILMFSLVVVLQQILPGKIRKKQEEPIKVL